MTKVRIYQVVDSCSEGVISTFVAPNAKFAVREFKKMLSDPKIKDNIDPSDFELVCSDEVEIAQCYADSSNLNLVINGGENVLSPVEVSDEA